MSRSPRCKRPVNVALPAELLARARRHRINLSATLQGALEVALAPAGREAWPAEAVADPAAPHHAGEVPVTWDDALQQR